MSKREPGMVALSWVERMAHFVSIPLSIFDSKLEASQAGVCCSGRALECRYSLIRTARTQSMHLSESSTYFLTRAVQFEEKGEVQLLVLVQSCLGPIEQTFRSD